ncbi:MAG: metallophosphoesterase family protein [Oscillibacter sp.]
MSVKIVHAADFHLDSAFGALSAEQARQRRRESRELLTRLSNYVNQNGVDLVLLAGDLFDSDTTYRETLEAFSEALGAMRARVFIAPGNHDPYSAKSPYATLSWPENVHVFTSKTVERVELPELQCAVYGAAFTAPVQDESLLAGFRAPEDDFIHLMVLHGDISATESRYDPLTKGQIKESGIDYLALGPHTSSAVSCAKGRRPTPTPAARRAAVSTSWAKRASLRARWSAGRPNFRLCRSRADGMRS